MKDSRRTPRRLSLQVQYPGMHRRHRRDECNLVHGRLRRRKEGAV